ncbi:asparagine synthase (glutamine-hydrolysing) [Amycolatopsis regifaucium]|nr:asparagine synthase (glutamine-hydrolysing) [Amycolatopsis regifaucium]
MPGLLGAFPGPAPTAGGRVPAEPVWPGETSWTAFGAWRHRELRTVRCPGGMLALVGQCFETDSVLREDFRRALEGDRLAEVTRWPGSYLAVVVRPEDVTAFVDLAGQYPLYFHTTPARTVLGTRARATARAAGLPLEPDVLTMAADMFCPGVPLPTAARSVYRGLGRLAGGQAMRVRRDGGCRTWTYETLVPDRNRSARDAAQALRAALENAVDARAGQPLTADFSGGLDSTSLAFLAARRRDGALPVFTYHHPDAPADDLLHAKRYLGFDRRLRSTVVTGTPESLSYRGLGTATATDLPDPGAVTQVRTRLRLRHVAAAGGGVHLGGEGADALLVAAPGYLGDLARQGELRRLGRECRQLAKQRRVASARVMARSAELSVTSLGRALRLLAGRFERPADRHIQWLDAIAWWPDLGAEATWLTTSMRKRLAELVRAGVGEFTPPEGAGVGDCAAVTEVRFSGAVQRQLDERARPYGVWPQAPFLDNHVIRACLTVPSYRRADPMTRKPLLGRALDGVVPGEVLSRTTKGNYTGEDYKGVRLASAELDARLSSTRLADLGLIEPDRVKESLSRAAAGLQAPFPALNRLLAADLWLRGLDGGEL